jgi:hypothetical protein
LESLCASDAKCNYLAAGAAAVVSAAGAATAVVSAAGAAGASVTAAVESAAGASSVFPPPLQATREAAMNAIAKNFFIVDGLNYLNNFTLYTGIRIR